ncbi:MAG: two-component system, cell cycle sensor histidine kinase and response regulator CckA [Clostridiales bacterium]|nr:two-component system, cell cycle sensor histidine kinase and response regulator CckA [Clostridiales bacterium]MDN5281412.1 two-component system, cell cycle sensor histidine kinase and response regulator CckA [Candidatus Ozemobacter sp.]
MNLDNISNDFCAFYGSFEVNLKESTICFASQCRKFLPIGDVETCSLNDFITLVCNDDKEAVSSFLKHEKNDARLFFTMQKTDSDPKKGPFCSVYFSICETTEEKLTGMAVNISLFMPGGYLYRDLKRLVEGIGEIRNITHDLNNQFQIISGFGCAIQEESQDAETVDCANNVVDAVTKAIEHNQALRNFFPPKTLPELILPVNQAEIAAIQTDPKPEKKTETITETNKETKNEAPKANSEKSADQSSEQTPANVLVIDDEPLVQRFLCEMLKRLKYFPYGFAGGKEALDFTRQGKTKFDLAIIDMHLPDISTEDLFQNLQDLDPEMKVILISGDNIIEASERMLKQGAKGYLQKPTTVKKLSETICQVLAG